MLKIDDILRIAKDTTIVLFGTIKVKGIIGTPNHYKCVNMVADDLPEDQHCKDIVIAQKVQVLKPETCIDKKFILQNFKNKERKKIAHVEASNIVPPLISSQMPENVPEQVVGNTPESNLLENLPGEKEGRSKRFLRV